MIKKVLFSGFVMAFFMVGFLAKADNSYGVLNETLGVNKTLSVDLNPLQSGSLSISGNSNPSVTEANLSGNSVLIKSKTAGNSTLSVCDSSIGNCLQINVAVSEVLGASTTNPHKPGSWVLDTSGNGKTVYYITASGVVPITSWKIFLNNGGKAQNIVIMNAADQNLPLLSFMTLKDIRVK